MLGINHYRLLVIVLITPSLLSQDTCEYQSTQPIGFARSDLNSARLNFTIHMLDALNKNTPNENIFFSPYSTYNALLLAYLGARGTTEEELSHTLFLNGIKHREAVRQVYETEKRERLSQVRQLSWNLVFFNKIYIDIDTELNNCIGDDVVVKTFSDNAIPIRSDINSRIANATNNKISEVIKSDDVSDDTNCLLVNAAYIKGQWQDRFDVRDTRKQIFYKSPYSMAFVNMMYRTGTYTIAIDENLGAILVDIPLSSINDKSAISMIIMLPPFTERNLETVISKLTPQILVNVLSNGLQRKVEIALPKFELEQVVELKAILKQMGLKSLFSENANLSGYDTKSKIKLDNAKHVAKISVDEMGSESVPELIFRPLLKEKESMKFHCNHPFIFIIYDHQSSSVLFTGIYRGPTS